MKLATSLSILLSANTIRVNAQCLTNFTFTAEHCSYQAFTTALQDTMEDDLACPEDKDASEEIEDLFGSEAEAKVRPFHNNAYTCSKLITCFRKDTHGLIRPGDLTF